MKKSMKTKSFETKIFKGWNWDIAYNIIKKVQI